MPLPDYDNVYDGADGEQADVFKDFIMVDSKPNLYEEVPLDKTPVNLKNTTTIRRITPPSI